MPPPRLHPSARRLAVAVLFVVLALSGGPPAAGHGPPDEVGPAAGSWPLQPRPDVVRRFDPPSSPWGSGHRGVDLAGHPGQAVRASMAGRITFAGPLAGRGVVVVDHGETRTTYEPVVASVGIGEIVAVGAALGSLSRVASHCAPAACLHWGWLRGDTYLDPLLLVGAAPVRLLPLSGSAPVATHPSQARPPAPVPGRPWPALAQARGWACW